MTREEILALLRQRIPNGETISLLDRRYPDAEPPLELVPRALDLLAGQEDDLARVAQVIPEMTTECRTILRLYLQGRSFPEMSEEMEANAVAVYAKCRKRLFPSSSPLPDYAAGVLDAEDRLALFGRALEDPQVFQSLRDEHRLLMLLDNAASRARLLEATEDVRFTIGGSLREWFERPRSKVLVALGVIALLSIFVQECGKAFNRSNTDHVLKP